MLKTIRIGLAYLITTSVGLISSCFGQTVETLPNGARLTLASGETVLVQICGDRIIHVSAQPKGAPAIPASYVINHVWEPTKFLVKTDDASALVLATSKLQIRIDRASGAVSFQDAQGTPILGEKDRSFTPVSVNQENTYQVEQSFHSPEDESLYGLGQFQEGHWNWKGIPLEFRQVNTQVVVPMLLSNKGYGLLWDNASMTEFNPVDNEIPLSATATPEDANAPKATEDLGKTPAKKQENKHAVRSGTFTSGAEGDYVFLADNGNRSQELSILINGEPILSMNNVWLPYSCSAVKHLPAHTTVKVALRGGGANARLSARPLHPEITTFRSPVGNGTDYYFFYGPSLDEVISEYRLATGAAPLFPEWAYGFWQCRERYASSDELVAVATELRKQNIPVDLIVQDWQYWGKYGWGAYQWDESHYPDPAKLIKDLHDLHVRFMISVWPNPSGPVHEALKAVPHGLLGVGSLYDPTNPEARKIRWSYLQKAFFDIGTDAWWQDAAEPMDPGNDMAGKDTYLGSGDFYRDSFPLFHSECLYDGQRAANPEKRVVNLTRSGYLGQQRYGTCTWSGDIAGDWITFRRQIPAGLNFCMTGLPYWTTDTAGFFHPRNQYKSEDYNELLVRWFQFSTFCPVLRVHGYQTHTEFWNFLPETQNQLTAYDEFRHRLLPYTYSMAWQVTHAGSTLMRALPFDFRTDAKACSISDEYMFGNAFLVSPVTEPKATTRTVYLPQGTTWYDFWTGTKTEGGQEVHAPTPLAQIPLNLPAGSILPLGPVVQYAREKPADPIELRVYPGQDGHLDFYEDEGDSYRYEQGVRAIIPLSWDEKTRTLTVGERQGSFPGILKQRTFQIVWVRPGHGTGMGVTQDVDVTLHYDGTQQTVQMKQ